MSYITPCNKSSVEMRDSRGKRNNGVLQHVYQFMIGGCRKSLIVSLAFENIHLCSTHLKYSDAASLSHN